MDLSESADLSEVAQRAGVSERVALYWARHGLIPGVYQTGYKEWRISRADLDAWRPQLEPDNSNLKPLALLAAITNVAFLMLVSAVTEVEAADL